MKNNYLVNYSVKGMKGLEEKVSLSFYKKVIPRVIDTKEYNIKGIYGMNGAGKSGIIASVEILKNIILNSEYLNNPIVQRNLDAMINKKSEELAIEVEYLSKFKKGMMLYKYKVVLSKDRNKLGRYVISSEELCGKKATSKKDFMEIIFRVENGEIEINDKDLEFIALFSRKTANLLMTSSVSALFYEKIILPTFSQEENYGEYFFDDFIYLYVFGKNLCIYMDRMDDHSDFFANDFLRVISDREKKIAKLDEIRNAVEKMNIATMNVIDIIDNIVPKIYYKNFEKMVQKLFEFLRIFKPDLEGIEIDRKEREEEYLCSLLMKYPSYQIHAEFESTGIKKLIKLFSYLSEMVRGAIVFIDELDSNLHDVYLCALLEYLMEYGEGQLCFTTHNVGPMDILKRNKKAIDFLSMDHTIYPWKTNGNYSPSKLYRNGMIEGSPFNVDSTSFIRAFYFEEEE